MTLLRSMIFDLDDTLYDESTYLKAGFRAAVAALERDIDVSLAEAVEVLCEIEASEGRGRVFDHFLRGLDLPASWVPAMVHAYRTCTPRLRLFSDAHQLLRRLKRNAIPTAVVTDGHGLVQDAKVRSLGLTSLVDVVVYTDVLGTGLSKPSTTGFEVALKRLCADAEASVYVGNDVRKDFLGPRRMGMASVLVTRRLLGDPGVVSAELLPDITVTTLAELDAMATVRGAAIHIHSDGPKHSDRQLAETGVCDED